MLTATPDRQAEKQALNNRFISVSLLPDSKFKTPEAVTKSAWPGRVLDVPSYTIKATPGLRR